MRRLLYAALFALTISGSAHAWQDAWIESTKLFKSKNYDAAEQKINVAISELERRHDISHPYVYVDRAYIHFKQNRFDDVFVDTDIAIASNCMDNSDKIDCYTIRVLASAHSNDMKFFMENHHKLEEIHPYLPKFQILEDKVIVRNFEPSESARNMIRLFLISGGFCESESDIEYLGNIIIGHRKISPANAATIPETCGCGCGGGCGDGMKPKNCLDWCERAYTTVCIWCGYTFADRRCAATCYAGAYIFYGMCKTCCGDGKTNCTRYFNAINDYMAKYGCRID